MARIRKTPTTVAAETKTEVEAQTPATEETKTLVMDYGPLVDLDEKIFEEPKVEEPKVEEPKTEDEPQIERILLEDSIGSLLKSLDSLAQSQSKAKAPTKKLGIGKIVTKMIMENVRLTNDEILAEVMKNFPEAQTNKNCISWYRSDLKKKGLI